MKAALIAMTFALSVAVLPSHAEVPRVETDFGEMGARDWAGKRFRDVVPPDRIRRIIRLTEHGFAHHNNGLPGYLSLVQADYDRLVAHLIASNEAATNLGLDAREGVSATLLILTTDEQVFRLEILVREQEISAVIINGVKHGARIAVKGFRRVAAK